MILCSDNHEEICYDGGWCPLCDMKEKLDIANDKAEELQEILDGLE